MLRFIGRVGSMRGIAAAALGLLAVALGPEICYGPVIPAGIAPPGTQIRQIQQKAEFDKMVGNGTMQIVLNGKPWIVKLDASSEVKVTGTGSAAALRKGMYIRFKGTFDSHHKGTEEIKDVEIFSLDKNNQPTAAPESEAFNPGGKKNNEPKEWTVAGRITDIRLSGAADAKKYKCKIDCGNVKNMTCDISPDATVKLAASDPSFAASGDKADVYLAYGREGLAYGVSVTIELAKPLPEPAKKGPKGAKATDKAASDKSTSTKKPADAKSPDANGDDKKAAAKPDDKKPDAAAADAGKLFDSKVGNFSIQFPTDPQTKDQNQDTPKGKLAVHSFTVEKDGVTHSVIYADLGDILSADEKKSLNADKVLEGSKGGIVAQTKLQVVKENKITLGNSPGIELQLASADASTEFTWRIYIVGTRRYQVILGGPKAKLPAAEAQQKFFESFKLLSE